MNRLGVLLTVLCLGGLGGCGSAWEEAHQRLLGLHAVFVYALIDGERVPTEVHLCGRQYGDVEIAELRHLTHLKSATLTTDYLTARGLRALAALPKLQNLNLPALRWTPECGKALASIPQLKRLALSAESLASAGPDLATLLPGVEVVVFEEAAPLMIHLRTLRESSPIPLLK